MLAGPLLAREAEAAGIVYSMAYGDQPALTCELVDWGRLCGFEVAAAGKGTQYLPVYHASTPATVWDYYGLTAAQAEAARMNSQMFNSFLDGTKSAIEMAAIGNATGLTPAPGGLAFPPCGTDDLPHEHAACRGWRFAASQGTGGSRFIPGTRWPTRISRPALGRIRGGLKRRMPTPRTVSRSTASLPMTRGAMPPCTSRIT